MDAAGNSLFSSHRGELVQQEFRRCKRVGPGVHDGSLDHQQTEKEEMAFVEGNKLFSRPASCDLGLSAICTFS